MSEFIGDLTKTAGLAGTFASVWSSRFLGTRGSQAPIVNLYINRRCNSRCVTCDVWKRPAGGEELTAEEILGLIPPMRRLKTRLVSISGGEPTLRGDLEEIIAGFSAAGIAVHINTNALDIGRGRAESLADAGLNVVYVSCDHPDREGYEKIRGVDGLERVAAAVEHFRSVPRPPAVGINVTVSRLNQDSLERLADLCAGWGVRKIQFMPAQKSQGLLELGFTDAEFEPLVPDDLPELKKTLRGIAAKLRKRGIVTNSDFFIDWFDAAYTLRKPVPCVAGSLFVNVDAGGEVNPCFKFRTGLSVREAPLDEILKSEIFRERRARVARCAHPCMDTGSAEPSIRFHIPYVVAHPLESYRQSRMHVG